MPERSVNENRVLLIHPGLYDDHVCRSYPPWGILAVGAACRSAGAEVVVADLCGRPIQATMSDLVSKVDPTVIGVTAKLGNGARRMRRVLDHIRESSDLPVGVGGPLVSTFPARENPLWNGVDALFWGDGEESFPAWMAQGCPRVETVEPLEIEDLDLVGLPVWWEGLEEYISEAEWWPGLKVRSMHVSAARGCSRRCTFCYLNKQHVGLRFRVVSPYRLLEGCDSANEKWGVQGFYFVDDCLLVPDSRQTEELIKLLVERGSPYRFGCDLQLHELEDASFLERLYAAGFRSLYVGVECASARIRRLLGKGRTTAPVRETLRRTLDMGFVIRASFGVGWPDESMGEAEDTLRLIEDLPDLMFDAFRYTPLPGVPLTRYYGRTIGASPGEENALSPFVDYSEFSQNHSTLPDEESEDLWDRLIDLERERHERYFVRRPVLRC